MLAISRSMIGSRFGAPSATKGRSRSARRRIMGGALFMAFCRRRAIPYHRAMLYRMSQIFPEAAAAGAEGFGVRWLAIALDFSGTELQKKSLLLRSLLFLVMLSLA